MRILYIERRVFTPVQNLPYPTHRNISVADEACAHEKQKQEHCHSIISGHGGVPRPNRYGSVQPVLDSPDNAPGQSDHPDHYSPLTSGSFTAGFGTLFSVRIGSHAKGFNLTNHKA